jgi:DNA polymerase elongation subunit (family B)
MLATRYHKVLTYRRLKGKMVLESDLLNMGGKGKIGAFVYAGRPGLWKWGVSIDVASMYPSIYLTMNAGVDTIIEPQETVWNKHGLFIKNKGGRLYRFDELIFAPSGAIYHKKEVSVDRDIFQDFGDIRKSKKKLRDQSPAGSKTWKKNNAEQKRIKVCMNSRFGIAPVDIFNTATVTGKYILQRVADFLGDDVVNGDTDGLQILVEAETLEEAIEKGTEITRKVNVYIEEMVKEFGADTNFLRMELESVFDRILVHMKKMYMKRLVWKQGRVLDPPEYEFKGFKIKRSDSSQAMDDLFYQSVDVILDSPNMKTAKLNFSSFLRKWHRRFPTFSPMYISITKALSKYMDDYKNTFESRAAKFTKEYFGKEYLPGETFNILSLSQTPAKINDKDVLKPFITPNAVIAFDRLHMHFLEDMEVDYKEMENKTISCIKPFLELLDVKYWRAVSLVGGGLFR